MSRRNRAVGFLAILCVIAGFVWPVLTAAPAVPAYAQDDTETRGRPPEFPPEVIVDDSYFLFDRLVPFLAETLVEIGEQEGFVVFAATAEPPFGRVFLATQPDPDVLARYLPEVPLGPDQTPLVANACPAQPPEFGDLQTDAGTYAYAGPEQDIALDTLTSLGPTAEGFTVYADPEAQPSPELLVDTSDEVFRFVLLDEQGRPPVLGDTLQFGGVAYQFAGDQAGAVDEGTLAPVGCAGPFPLSAPAEQVDAGAISQLYATVDARLFAYTAEEGIPASPEPEAVGDEPGITEDAGTPAPDAGTPAEAIAEDEAVEPGSTPPPTDMEGAPSETQACAAETANFTVLAVGDAQYAYGGPEADLTADQLQPVFQTSEDQPVYAATTEQPFPELFIEIDGTLSRFVLLDERGVPVTLGDTVSFDGQTFAFDRGATGEVAPDALTRVGCVGPFSARTDPGATAGELSQLFVVINDETPRVLAFVATDAAPEPASPPSEPEATVVAPVEEPTEAPTDAPTATPLPPTETPIPAPPTETPVPPTATLVPATETPVPPTATPVLPTPTMVVVVATEIPATVAPAATPSVEETPAPAAGTPETPSDVAPTPLALPTVVPPMTPVSAIPVDAPAPVPDELPREIQVQGIRYLFDLEVNVDPQTLVQVDVVQTPTTTLNIFASPEDQVNSTRLSYRQSALTGPFGRVYAVSVATGVVARYVSELPIGTGGIIDVAAPCSAESAPRTFSHTFENQLYTYTFASVETNVSVEQLRSETTAALGQIPLAEDGREILVRASGYPGLAEVFLPAEGTLERYIALNAAGVPVTMNNLLFAETRFRYETQVSVTIEESAFRRIGCAGPFPLFAPIEQAEAAAPLRTSFTVIDTRVYQFVATEIVVAPTGQVPPPSTIVPPPPGFVQITLETTIVVGPRPTPLPNIRVVPLPVDSEAVTPTPPSGLVIELPVRQRRCQGDPGDIGANGLPERLPARIQLSGVAYAFVGEEQAANDIRLSRVGCVGPFEAVQPEGTGVGRVVYLRTDRAAQIFYRYEAVTSFGIDFVVAGDARVITAGDQRYVLAETWDRSIYSSVTVIVYAQDPQAADPPRVYAVPVDGDVVAEYVPEGGDVVEAPEELRVRAEESGINPDLVLGGGRRYLLVNLWSPIGTTTNGWVTLYAVGAGADETLLATDPRSLELFVYRR